MPLRPCDHQVGLVLFGGRNDGVRHDVGAANHPLGFHALDACRFLYRIYSDLCFFGPLTFNACNIFGIERNTALKIRQWITWNYFHCNELCTASGGQANGAGNSFFAQG
jgi:hypothetical protein